MVIIIMLGTKIVRGFVRIVRIYRVSLADGWEYRNRSRNGYTTEKAQKSNIVVFGQNTSSDIRWKSTEIISITVSIA